jgi:ribulose-phosphate 3-epimerase
VCAAVRTARPDGLITQLAEAGCTTIALDAGAPIHLHRALAVIRDAGASPAILLTPSAPLTQAEFLLAEADSLILDAVEPGQGSSTLLGSLCERLRILREFVRSERGTKRIVVAGLRTPYEAAQALDAGADAATLGETALSKEGMRAFRADLAARLKALGSPA